MSLCGVSLRGGEFGRTPFAIHEGVCSQRNLSGTRKQLRDDPNTTGRSGRRSVNSMTRQSPQLQLGDILAHEEAEVLADASTHDLRAEEGMLVVTECVGDRCELDEEIQAEGLVIVIVKHEEREDRLPERRALIRFAA